MQNVKQGNDALRVEMEANRQEAQEAIAQLDNREKLALTADAGLQASVAAMREQRRRDQLKGKGAFVTFGGAATHK